MAEEEEKKVEEEQPAESEKEDEPKESQAEPEAEEEETKPPVPSSKAPTVEDIEDVLKEALMEEPGEQDVEAPDVKAPPAKEVPKSEETPLPEEVEELIAPPETSLPAEEDKPEKEEDIVITPEEKQEGGEKLETPPVIEPVEETKEEVAEPDIPEQPKDPEAQRVEETPVADEPIKIEVAEKKAEEPKPKEEPEPPKEKEVQDEKTEEPEAPQEKTEEAKAEKKLKPSKEKKAKDGKPKRAGKADKKEAPEKQTEPEKPAPRKAKKPPAEDPDMIISPFLFGKFDLRDVEVADPGLRKYINLVPVGIPHTGARHANRWLGKTKVNIVERLINNLMRTQHSTGKKSFSYRAVNNAFDIILKRTKQNPIQVLVDALQNASPKEEITRLRFGGISVPKAVDTSSSRRLDIALRNLCKGTISSSHRNRKRMEMCLAEEIILASKGDMNSFAISKKEEMERIAASAR